MRVWVLASWLGQPRKAVSLQHTIGAATVHEPISESDSFVRWGQLQRVAKREGVVEDSSVAVVAR